VTQSIQPLPLGTQYFLALSCMLIVFEDAASGAWTYCIAVTNMLVSLKRGTTNKCAPNQYLIKIVGTRMATTQELM